MKNTSGVLLISIIFSCAATFWLGYSMRPKATSAPVVAPAPMPLDSSLDGVKKKFEELARIDYEQYLQLKTSEEKFKKADEILGKVMQIFLVDLGLHVRNTATMVATPSPSVAVLNTTTFDARASSAVNASKAPTSYRQGSLSVYLAGLKDQGQIDAFLKTNELSNFKQTLFDSKLVNKPSPALIGCFEGDVVLNDSKLWQMKMMHDFKDASISTQGRYRILLIDNGKVLSKSSGKGVAPHLRSLPNSPDEILIQVSPEKYFQMYFLPQSETFVGNFYESIKDENFNLKGKVTLHRGSGCEE